MGTTLARRNQRPRSLLTKELKRRASFTKWEMVKIYMPISQVITGLLLLGFAVTSDVTQFAGPFSTALVETLAYTTSLILLIWGVMWFFWAISRDKGVMSLSDRRDQFELDAIRKNRPHRDDELARLKELDSKYSRYSILVKRDKKAIKLIAVEHKPANYRMPTPFLRYKSVTSKKLYNVDNESWDGKSAVKWKIDNPTVDKVMRVRARMVSLILSPSWSMALASFSLPSAG